MSDFIAVGFEDPTFCSACGRQHEAEFKVVGGFDPVTGKDRRTGIPFRVCHTEGCQWNGYPRFFWERRSMFDRTKGWKREAQYY